MGVTTKILRIGIASRDEMRDRAVAIARGQHKPAPGEPKVWFTSLESLAQVLSRNNRLLLEIIRQAKPASLKELAKLSGRQEGNLNRTLHTMERYRLVRLKKGERGRIVPDVPYDRLAFDVSLSVRAADTRRLKRVAG